MEQKVIDFKGIELRLKEPNPLMFAAWQTQLATAMQSNDATKIAAAYKTMFTWLEVKTLGVWTTAWDTKKEEFGVPALNKTSTMMELVGIVMSELIEPFFE